MRSGNCASMIDDLAIDSTTATSGPPQRVGGQPPALRAGNRLPLRALTQSRRVTAHSHEIRHAARNARCTSGHENAPVELAAETSLSRFPCFALRAACAGGCPTPRCTVPDSAVAFCRGRSTMSAATPEAQKRRSGLIDRVRPTPLGASALTRRQSSGGCERLSAAANR